MKLTPHAILTLLLAAALAASGLLLVRSNTERTRLAAELDQSAKTRAAAEDQIAAVHSENDTLRKQLEAEGLQPAAPRTSVRTVDPARLEAVKELAQLQNRYAALQSSLKDVQNRTAELEGTIERLNTENKRLTSAEADLKDQLASTQRVVQAMEPELKTKADRITQLEASLRKFQDEASGADRRQSQIAAVIRELEDINRRRENAINSIQRRYRDVSDQLRSLALRLDTQRETATPVGATDLSRISTAVQGAEDDLRQLATLNTQAQRATARLR